MPCVLAYEALYVTVCMGGSCREGKNWRLPPWGLHIEIKEGADINIRTSWPNKLDPLLTTFQMRDVVSLCFTAGILIETEISCDGCYQWSLYLGLIVVVIALL